MNRFILTLLFILIVSSLLDPTASFAQVNTGLGRISTDPKELVSDILRFALGIAGGIAFLMIVYSGFRLAFSKGDPEAVQGARDMITSAVVGLLIIVFSTFILRLVGIDILGLPL